MKLHLFRLLALTFPIGLCAFAAQKSAHAAKIRVVTTLTDLADFAREIGGDHVEVFSLATGVEDTHGVPMKPSFVPLMNRADLLVSRALAANTPSCPPWRKPARIHASNLAIPPRGLLPGHLPLRSAQVHGPLRRRRSSLRQPSLHARPGDRQNRRPAHLQRAGDVRPAVSGGLRPQPRCLPGQTRREDRRVAKAKALKGVKFVSYHEHWPTSRTASA